jgi:hypothetical protein
VGIERIVIKDFNTAGRQECIVLQSTNDLQTDEGVLIFVQSTGDTPSYFCFYRDNKNKVVTGLRKGYQPFPQFRVGQSLTLQPPDISKKIVVLMANCIFALK